MCHSNATTRILEWLNWNYLNRHIRINDLDNHNVVITHLEPDILECEVKWTLGSIIINKASEGDGILAETIENPKRWYC